jgi:hypothetical protein
MKLRFILFLPALLVALAMTASVSQRAYSEASELSCSDENSEFSKFCGQWIGNISDEGTTIEAFITILGATARDITFEIMSTSSSGNVVLGPRSITSASIHENKVVLEAVTSKGRGFSVILVFKPSPQNPSQLVALARIKPWSGGAFTGKLKQVHP